MSDVSRPILTVDVDGVLAAPPLGLPNLFIGRRLLTHELPAEVLRRDLSASARARRVAGWLHRLRYSRRQPLPGVEQGLAALSEHRELVIVTGRSWHGRAVLDEWLRRHGLRHYFSAIHINNTRLVSAQFKLHTARQLGAREHVDDDGSIVHYLATHGLQRVFLRDWGLNRGLPYPSHVVVVASLLELADYLTQHGNPLQDQSR